MHEKTPPADAARDLAARLWAIGSPAPLTDYCPPWDGIAADLWARLLAALAAPAAHKVAAEAALLSYAKCAQTLAGGAPAVHRALMEVRGLALAAVPDLVAKLRPPEAAAPPKVKLPGELLVYEEVDP